MTDQQDMARLLDDPGLQPGDFAERVSRLSRDELRLLRSYEQDHAQRPFVLALLDRLVPREPDPTGGAPTEGQPALSPESQAAPAAPPPHGNPAQPGQPKGNRPTSA